MNKFDITAWGCITSPDTSKKHKNLRKKLNSSFKKNTEKNIWHILLGGEIGV